MSQYLCPEFLMVVTLAAAYLSIAVLVLIDSFRKEPRP
jgi:hypothetical protein